MKEKEKYNRLVDEEDHVMYIDISSIAQSTVGN